MKKLNEHVLRYSGMYLILLITADILLALLVTHYFNEGVRQRRQSKLDIIALQTKMISNQDTLLNSNKLEDIDSMIKQLTNATDTKTK